jgi:hypothetical protein
MLLLTLLILLVLSLAYWLFTPVLHALTPFLSTAWLGWGLLALSLWLLAGSSSDEPPSRPQA